MCGQWFVGIGLCCVLGLNALQLLNAAAAGGSGPNPSSMPNSYGLYHFQPRHMGSLS